MSEWISVSERLPELQTSVLVFQQDDDNAWDCSTYVAWIDKLGIENKPIWQYSWCCGCFVPRSVTHWQNLPEPPNNA